MTPDEQRVVSASCDWTLKVWNLACGTEVATLRGHQRQVYACAVTPDGQRAVSASHDRTLKQIYRHDVELDSLWGVMQVGLVFLVTYLLKVYFNDARMDPVTFLERVATLPARRNLTPHVEIITFEYNRRDPEVMTLLLAHHEAINARALRLRSGRILRIQVDPAPKPTRPPPSQRRTNSADRFHKSQPKV